MNWRLVFIVIFLCQLILLSFVPGLALPESYFVWVNMGEDDQVRVINSSSYEVVSVVNITKGSFPWEISFSHDGLKCYIVCRDTNNVVVLDTENFQETVSIEVGFQPFDISLSPDGRTAYVSNLGDGTVSVIDVDTTSAVATIEVGEEPRSIIISPDGDRAYVCLSKDEKLAIIDIEDNSLLKTIEVEGEPWGVDLSPDGERAYVSCQSIDKVAVVSLSENRVLKRIDVNEKPRGVATLPERDQVYVPANNAVAIIDITGNTKIDASGIDGWGWAAAITPDGKYAFVSKGEYTGEEGVIVIDTERMEKIKTVFLGEETFGPRGIAIHPVTSSGKVITTISCKSEKTVMEGQLVNITGLIAPPMKKIVTLNLIRPNGSTFNKEVSTNSKGEFNYSFSPGLRGKWEVKSLWEGDDEYLEASSSSFHFEVRGMDEGLPPFLVMGAIVAIVILIILYLRRRTRSSDTETGEEKEGMRASRILQIIRDIMLVVLSIVLLASSYGKWVEEPVHYILFGVAAALLVLTIINLILIALNVNRKGFYYFNAGIQIILGFFLIIIIVGIFVVILNVLIIIALRRGKAKKLPPES